MLQGTRCYDGFDASEISNRGATDNAVGYAASNAALMVQVREPSQRENMAWLFALVVEEDVGEPSYSRPHLVGAHADKNVTKWPLGLVDRRQALVGRSLSASSDLLLFAAASASLPSMSSARQRNTCSLLPASLPASPDVGGRAQRY